MAADGRRAAKPDMAEAATQLATIRPYLDGEATLTRVAADASVLQTPKRSLRS